MPTRFLSFLSFAAVLLAVGAGPAQAYIIEGRWTRTATNSSTGSRGTPITLTWGFPPDGTTIPTSVSNNLQNFLDTNWGIGPGGSDLTQRPWYPIFSQATERLSALSGVTFNYEPNDDGRSFANTTSAQGVLGVRGDIRLGGKSYGVGSDTLASNFFPNYGEMMINTDQVSYLTNSSSNYRRFRNTLMHELMHGLGISHVDSSDAAFLIEPSISGAFDGPQLDDLLALQRNYGDTSEKDGGNDTYDRATPLGLLNSTQSLAIGALGSSTTIGASQVDFMSIDDDSDTDFFSFTIDNRLDVRLQLTPRGTSYLVGPEDGTQTTLNTLALSNLSLALMDTNGTSVLASADSNGAGSGEEVTLQLLPGTWFARVKGANDNIQLYGLDLTATTPAPRNLLWVGNLSSIWNVGVTANFSVGGASTMFFDLDNVTFNDTSTTKTVTLAEDISAGNINITTASGYTFTGAGSIVVGSVTINGTGTVTLATSGNSYSGATQVQAGTLRITGNVDAMVSPITVANSARLMMDATSAGTLDSPLTISGNGAGNGAIQIASGRTANFGGNVSLASSAAAIHVEANATGTFQSTVNGAANNARLTLQVASGGNANLQGAVSLANGGITKLGAGTGTLAGALNYSGPTIVDQGTLRLTGSGPLSGDFQLAQGATLDLAGSHQFQAAADLTGSGTVAGNMVMPGTIAPGASAGALTFENNLTLTGTSVLEIELGGTVAGVSFDALDIAGSATLAGMLDVSRINSFNPALGNSFEVLHADFGVFGEFDQLVLPALLPQLEWNVVYSSVAVLLNVVSPNATVPPGDYNNDGFVNAADYIVWRSTLGDVGINLPADGNNNDVIDNGDYNVWTANFGQTDGPGSASGLGAFSSVPEPASFGILLGFIVLLAAARWRS